MEPVYSDMIKRAGKWRKQHSNGSQPLDLIQLDMVGQKPFTIVPLAPTRPATHTFPLSWLSAIADVELEWPPTDINLQDRAWASMQGMGEAVGLGQAKLGIIAKFGCS